jgi:hypothetical protein
VLHALHARSEALQVGEAELAGGRQAAVLLWDGVGGRQAAPEGQGAEAVAHAQCAPADPAHRAHPLRHRLLVEHAALLQLRHVHLHLQKM